MRKVSIAAVLCFLFSLPSHAETIHYSIRQMGFDGQATLTMVGPKEFMGHKTILILFKAHGVNYFDQENIYIDPDTYQPLFVQREFSLGLFGHGKILEKYVPSENAVIITKQSDGKTTTEVLHGSGPVDNIYALIYRYRKAGSFKVGDVVKMPLPTRTIKMQLLKETSLKIGGKTYGSYFMQSQPVKYKIWFDTSDKKPLRITGTIGFINSVMTMTSYEP